MATVEVKNLKNERVGEVELKDKVFGQPLNEAQQIAESTMTGILAREACYSGQEITWDDAMKSTFVRGPEEVKFGPYEIEAVAKPGTYKFV